MKNNYLRRIQQIRKALKRSGQNEALLVGSNPPAWGMHGSSSMARSNANLLYLSGSCSDNALLLIRADDNVPTLLVQERSKQAIDFDGKGEDSAAIARQIGARVEVVKDPAQRVLPLLRGVERLHFPFLKDSLPWKVGNQLLQLSWAQRRLLPAHLVDADPLMAELRMFKDASEVALIREASALTHRALYSAVPLMVQGTREAAVAARIENEFRSNGAALGFETIAASGASASILHYRDFKRTLKRSELLVIDCGARIDHYSADITRTVPVNGVFSPALRKLYDIVLDAHQIGISKVRPGVKLESVFEAVAERLTRGLVSLKVLSGNIRSLVKRRSYEAWCPHSFGHLLGLDVHDIGWFRMAGRVLEPGMVFTMEPGLYFTRPAGILPRCGIRIEDDLLVTARGCEVLTAGTRVAPEFPKDPEELVKLFS